MASPVPKERCGDYDFVEQPPEEYLCPVSFAVLLEPYQTQCCGNHLAKESYERLQGQPCPVCREENLTAMKDKFHKRRVLSLKVRCPHKAEGCEWEGELGSLEQHLNTSNNASSVAVVAACQYVDVDCPHSCGESFKRHALQLHVKDCMLSMLAQEVPKLKVIVQEQFKQQADLIKQLENQIKQKGNQFKQQGDKIKQQGDQIKQQGDQIKQQGDQIKQQEDQIKALMKFNKLVVPPVDIVMDEFEEHKDDDSSWYSPPFYSHLGGYKMCLNVDANGCGKMEGTHVSVFVCLMKGEFDDDLTWPFNGDVVIQLKRKYLRKRELILSLDSDDGKMVSKPTTERNNSIGYIAFISHRDLYTGNYLMNDKLTFCISDITVLRE